MQWLVMPLLGCHPHPLGLCWGCPMSRFGDTQVCPLAALEMCWEFPWWRRWKQRVPHAWEGFLVFLCCGSRWAVLQWQQPLAVVVWGWD